jgi:16S rRNA (uracil1498-N3)-methyltransferase
VQAPADAAAFFRQAGDGPLNLILTERHAGQSLTSLALPHGRDALIRLAVGPEGGWTPEEAEQAINCGFVPVSMGDCILRAETTALAALSILQSRLGELG